MYRLRQGRDKGQLYFIQSGSNITKWQTPVCHRSSSWNANSKSSLQHNHVFSPPMEKMSNKKNIKKQKIKRYIYIVLYISIYNNNGRLGVELASLHAAR